MTNGWIGIGASSAALAVVAGAFAAHGLRARLPADLLAVFEIAVRYQMYHALGLIAIGLAARAPGLSPGLLQASGWLFVAGSLAFCGSLYWLALGGPRSMGAVAPIGGAALIAGWLCLAVAALRTGG